MSNYTNYGDIDYWEHGGMFAMQESETTFSVLYLAHLNSDTLDFYNINEPERNIYFADCYVDISDSWIERDKVMSLIGMEEENYDPALFAVGCVEYYGCSEFNSEWDFIKTRSEVKEILKAYGIE